MPPLDPHERVLVLEALRPPDGYRLGHAIGTTYSLDLLALLTAPLAFSVFDIGEAEEADSLALLDAVRRNASRITLFCEAGRIALPPPDRPLLAWLERSVVEVRPPVGGSFHPKVWLLRFVGDDSSVRYRFLCLSRNLTFDRSWDVCIAVEGTVADRTRAIRKNRPLGDFIDRLPEMASRVLPETARTALQEMSDEVRRVRFELPEGSEFDDFVFWPLGIMGHKKWPFDGLESRRLLVVSPFLSAEALDRLTEERTGTLLVSRHESLEGLSAGELGRFDEIFVLSDDLSSSDATVAPDGDIGSALQGLHAKLYVVDDGWDSHTFAGSANATNAGFWQNVEFLLQLTGKRSKCGIDTVLKEEPGVPGFRALLTPYTPRNEPAPKDATHQRLETLLEDARRQLADAEVRIVAQETAEGAFRMTVRAEGVAPSPDPDVDVVLWPASLRDSSARPLGGSGSVEFGPVSLEALTSFVAFRLTARDGARSLSTVFVLNLPLSGVPEDREARLLRASLRDRGRFLRLLLLLLAEDAFDVIELFRGDPSNDPADAARSWISEPTLLESLLRALYRNPSRIDDIARLISALGAEREQVLPERFLEIWEPIHTAHSNRMDGGSGR